MSYENGFVNIARHREICVAHMTCKGAAHAVYDARVVAKQICCIPRHPSAPRPARLERLPKSLTTLSWLEQAHHELGEGEIQDEREAASASSVSSASLASSAASAVSASLRRLLLAAPGVRLRPTRAILRARPRSASALAAPPPPPPRTRADRARRRQSVRDSRGDETVGVDASIGGAFVFRGDPTPRVDATIRRGGSQRRRGRARRCIRDARVVRETGRDRRVARGESRRSSFEFGARGWPRDARRGGRRRSRLPRSRREMVRGGGRREGTASDFVPSDFKTGALIARHAPVAARWRSEMRATLERAVGDGRWPPSGTRCCTSPVANRADDAADHSAICGCPTARVFGARRNFAPRGFVRFGAGRRTRRGEGWSMSSGGVLSAPSKVRGVRAVELRRVRGALRRRRGRRRARRVRTTPGGVSGLRQDAVHH